MLQALRIPTASRVAPPRPTLAFPLGFVALFALYLYATGFIANNADNASILLEAQAMLHGNLILHGWYLPPDSFITTEMPLDALLSIFFRGEQLFRITPALLYAATVTGAAYLAAYLAAERTADPLARWLAAGACVALLAFPIGILFSLVMLGPIHMGTIAASVFAWWAYDRYVRRASARAGLGLFVVLTALAIVGDPLAEVTIVVPVCVVCVWVLWRARGKEMAALTMLCGALAALVLGLALRQALLLSGTHTASAPLALSSPEHIWLHVEWLFVGLCALFHIDTLKGVGLDLRLLVAILGGGFLVVGMVGFVRLFRRTLFPTDLRDSLHSGLSWAAVGGILAFVFSDFAMSIGGIRYLLPAFVSVSILGYSAFADVVSTRFLKQFILALVAVSVLTFGVALTQLQTPDAPEPPLIAFLERHHLTMGLSSYWANDITILRSSGSVQLIPIRLETTGIHGYRWHASDDWFQRDQLAAARFIVIDSTIPVVPFQSAVVATFGAPDHVYQVGQYTIFAWDRPFIAPGTTLG